MSEELTATLIINTLSSRCGHCDQPVTPQSIRHTDVSGWEGKPGAGCGARFVNTASDYPNITEDDLLRMRPDLPVRLTGMARPYYCYVAPTHVGDGTLVADLDDGKVSRQAGDAIRRMTGSAAEARMYVVWKLGTDRPNPLAAVRHATCTPFDSLVTRNDKSELIFLSRNLSKKILAPATVVTYTEAVLTASQEDRGN